MSSSIRNHIFVLWGDRFEALTATALVTELRRAGFRVKIVGISQRQTHGLHGLALIPDLTLEEALPLAEQTHCLIIPCKQTELRRLKNDPRLKEFLQRIVVGQSSLVVAADVVDTVTPFLTSTNKLITYPHDEKDFYSFLRQIGQNIG